METTTPSGLTFRRRLALLAVPVIVASTLVVCSGAAWMLHRNALVRADCIRQLGNNQCGLVGDELPVVLVFFFAPASWLVGSFTSFVLYFVIRPRDLMQHLRTSAIVVILHPAVVAIGLLLVFMAPW